MKRKHPSLFSAALLSLAGLAAPSVSHAQSAPFQVKELYPGERDTKYGVIPYSGSPQHFTRVRGRLLFVADSEAGHGLWRADGTPEGTRRLKSLPPFSGRPELLTVGDVAVLPLTDDPLHGAELWRTDGTEEGTVLLKDVTPGPAGSAPVLLAQSCDAVFFSVHPGVAWELWKTDGTEQGTVRMGALSGEPSASVAKVGSTVFFTVSERELWRTDGTEAGTLRLRTFTAPVRELTAGRSRAFFSARGEGDSYELWMSDGTEAGTARVKDIDTGNVTSAWPQMLYADGDRLYFRATSALTRYRPWVTDGTEAGTYQLKDVTLEANHHLGQAAALPGGRLLFWADAPGTTGGMQSALWVTDGSEAGTHSLRVLARDLDSPMVRAGAATLFFARESFPYDSPAQLWRTDGTVEGTMMMRTFTSGGSLEAVDGRIFFWAEGRLWTTEGTQESTRPLTLASSVAGSPLFFLDEARTTLLFSGGTQQTGSELFGVNIEPVPASAPLPPVATCEAPAPGQPEPEPRKGGCAAAGGSAAVLPGVLVLLLALRRRGSGRASA